MRIDIVEGSEHTLSIGSSSEKKNVTWKCLHHPGESNSSAVGVLLKLKLDENELFAFLLPKDEFVIVASSSGALSTFESFIHNKQDFEEQIFSKIRHHYKEIRDMV